MFKSDTKIKYLIPLLTITILFSCDKNRVFDEYKPFKNGSWSQNDKILFSFDVLDTVAKQNLFINLRNNNNYEFSNLFLITKLDFPDGKKIIDTLAYEMTDHTGKFLGSGYSEIKENKLFYKERITFPLKGTYKLSIESAMRKNGEINAVTKLNGVTEIGFRIEK